MIIKKNHFRLLIIVICLLARETVNAQALDPTLNSFMSFKSPQAHDLGNAVFSQVSMFTGKPSIVLPVYTIKHFGLEVPISLSYDAGGMIPNKAPSVVGLNWSLMAGGVITRNINNVPDETDNNNGNEGFRQGFFRKPVDYTNAQVTDVLSHTYNAPPYGKYYKHLYELAPDLFVFNFGRHSGQFMKGQDDQYRVQGDGIYKIQPKLRTFVAGQYAPGLDTSNISITDANGIRYDFGGSASSIEHSHNDIVTGNNGNPNAWYLTKITSPEGHTIEFKYAGDNGTPDGLLRGNSDFIVMDAKEGQSNLVRTAYLRSIECKTNTGVLTQTIKFNNDTNAAASSFSIYTNEHLKSIEVKDHTGVTKKTFEFTYDYKSFDLGNKARMILKSFGEAGLPKYTFGYYNEGSMGFGHSPDLIDYWGFYNGQSKSGVTGITYDVNEIEMTSTHSQFEPNLTLTQTGILKTITSPTQGITEYEYELNKYGYYYRLIASASIEGWVKTLLPSVRSAGGLRVSKIKMMDGANVLQTRQYKYVQGYTPSAGTLTSSGIATRTPSVFRYNLITTPALASVGEQPIYYSEVAEVFDDGGYKIHNFTAGEFPDRTFSPTASPAPYVIEWGTGTTKYYDDYRVINFYKKRSSTALERGKPSLITNYTNTGIRVSSTAYAYNTDPNRYTDKIVSIDVPVIGVMAKDFLGTGIANLLTTSEYYFFNTQLTKQEETLYNPAGTLPTMVTTTRFDYNGDRLVKRKTMVTSKGVEEIEKYKYANDYISPGLSTPLKEMQERHILAPLIEKQRLQKSGGLTKLLEGTLTTFKRIGTNNATYRPFEVRRLELTSASTDTTISSISSGNLAFHSLYANVPVTKFVAFDDNGNLLQYQKTADSPPISYKWGYNKQFPVAEIVNSNAAVFGTASGTQSKFVTVPINGSTANTPFETTQQASVNLTIQAEPGKAFQLDYYIVQSGSIIYSGTLCADRAGSGGCYSYPETVSIPNVPAGNYTLSIYYPSGTDVTYTKSMTVSYSGASTTILTQDEFYYEGFEEAFYDTALPHTGLKCFTGNFLVSWVKPAGKDYVISYWYRESGVWKFKAEQAYLGPMNLTGDAIDDIRIHPKNALMTTYTYDPLSGMTSQTDPKGMTTYYEYDSFQRLMNVKDQDGKIMSNTQYNYKP